MIQNTFFELAPFQTMWDERQVDLEIERAEKFKKESKRTDWDRYLEMNERKLTSVMELQELVSSFMIYIYMSYIYHIYHCKKFTKY